jgi:hypothetical protein
MALVACIIPIILHNVQEKILSKWFQNPTPTAWDYYFKQRKSCFIKIYLKNSSMIGGYFSNNSYATSFPNEGDIYLECQWSFDADGHFLEPLHGSKGILARRSLTNAPDTLLQQQALASRHSLREEALDQDLKKISPLNLRLLLTICIEGSLLAPFSVE